MTGDYSRSEQLADDLMHEHGASGMSGDTYATEHIPKAPKPKKNDLTTREYYFEGIEKLTQGQINTLDKLYQRRDELKRELDRLSGTTPDVTAPVRVVRKTLSSEQISANQRKRIAGIDIRTFVKAGWQFESGNNYAAIWNPDNILPDSGATAVLIPVKGLKPSKSDPSRSNLQQILAGEQQPELWEPGLDSIFMSIRHATEEEWTALQTNYLSPEASRKDKAPKQTKQKAPASPRKKRGKPSLKDSEILQDETVLSLPDQPILVQVEFNLSVHTKP